MNKGNKLTLPVPTLQGALEIVRHALPSASAGVPMLRTVRFETTAAGTGISATDLNIGIRVTIPAEEELAKPLILSSEKLLNYVKLLDGDKVTISTKSEDSHRAWLTCGDIRGGIPCTEGAPGFTLPSGAAVIDVEQSKLRRMLGFVAFTITETADRYTLNGIQLEATGKELIAVATDGHRISIYSIPYECETASSLLIPAALVRALLATLKDSDGNVRIENTPDAIGITIAGEHLIEMRSQRLTGQFPNYRAVVPVSDRLQLDFQVATTLRAYQRCILMSDSQSQVVEMRFEKSTLTLRGATSESGESEEKISFSAVLPEPMRLGLKGTYVVDILKRLEGSVCMDIGDHKSVVMFHASPAEGEKLRYGIMPMRV